MLARVGEEEVKTYIALATSKNRPLETKPKPPPEVSYLSFLLRERYQSFKGSDLSTLVRWKRTGLYTYR